MSDAGSTTTGLLRVRSFGRMGRRAFGGGALALGASAALGLPRRAARAATDVTFVGWQGYDEPFYVGDFPKNNDITLNTTFIGNNDEILTKLTSGGLGQIDIVTPYMGYVPLLVAADLIQPIDPELVPNLASVLPLFRNDRNITVDGTLYAVPFTWGSGAMMYDPAVFPKPPAAWGDLLKPEYAGKVGMMDDPLGNITLAAIATFGAEQPTRLTPAQLTTCIDFLIQMKKQSRLVAVSWGDLADALSRRDIAATFNGWETIQKFCADQGRRIEYAYPAEGTYAWLDNYCIANDAPNYEAAHALANHGISTPAQKSLAEKAFQAIVNAEAIRALDPKVKALYPYDGIESYGEKARFYTFPPIEEEDGLATYEQWLADYQRFKTA